MVTAIRHGEVKPPWSPGPVVAAVDGAVDGCFTAVCARLSEARAPQMSAVVRDRRSDPPGGDEERGGDGGARGRGRRKPREEYRMGVVWCPLPLFTWFIPVIGHTGLASSSGVISDFVGPYTIHQARSRMGFGAVHKFLPVAPQHLHALRGMGPEEAAEAWDDAVDRANADYEQRLHTLVWTNCHTHVAVVLNELEYMGFRHWNTFFLAAAMVLWGRDVSFSRLLQTYGLFIILASAFLLFNALIVVGAMFL